MNRHALIAIVLLSGVVRQQGAAQDSLTSPGISRELARYRAAQISDVQYDLVLDVTARDTAAGRLTISFTSKRHDQDVILDFRGRSLGGVLVNGRGISAPAFNGAHLRLPAAAFRAGENRIELRFSTPIAAAGASIIRVVDPVDSATYLYTLLVPSDANLLFPCFDQPDLKARVRLTLVTPADWKAVANGARVSLDSTSRGVVHAFRESEPISTYLIAFAAGPWAEFHARESKRAITLYARRSRAGDVDADSLILANDRAVTWLERYFGSKFPFHKLDVVMAPAFPFGGMEHPGAIFYSEERFLYRERPTLTQQLGRTATIYHEIAHQWFGDLVTMEWFDDLWLKEGFATYMAAKMQDALDPAAESWKTFYLRNKPVAYQVDASEGTTPVWQQLANLDQAKSNYGPIVYNKAPSVLKQLNYTVGDSAFRAGVQLFLRKHAYANATWQDLVAAIAEGAGTSLSAWGDAYMLRPGMPVIQQELEVRAGKVVAARLIQRPARALSGTRPWPIKLEVLAWYKGAAPVRTVVTAAADTTSLPELVNRPAPAFVFANANDYGYALVTLDPASVSWLEEHIAEVNDAFLRSMLWGALWDLVRDARLSPERFLKMAVRELPTERDEQIVSALLGRVTRVASAYFTSVQRAAFLPDLERVLVANSRAASRPYGERKAFWDAFVRSVSTEAGLDLLNQSLDSATVAGEPLRAPTRWAMVARLLASSHSAGRDRLAAETLRDQSAEGRRRAFAANAAVADSAVKRAYFARYFGDRDLNEDWATSSLDAFNAIDQQQLTLPYLRPALDSLPWIQKNRRIFFLGSWLSGFLDGQTSEEALAEVRRFLSSQPQLPGDLRQKVLQATDELERTVRIRSVFGVSGA